jgi:alpha-1,2-glucosyltransferase
MTGNVGRTDYRIFGFFLLLALLLWGGILLFGDNKYADESDHIRQIHRFMKGNYQVLPNLTTVPGYHAVIAALAAPFGDPAPKQIRLISLALSLLSIGMFYALAKKLRVENPQTRTLQFVFLPISFLYFPLLYTDIFSLLLILVAFSFVLSGRYALSAIVSLAAVAVRQNNIIWVAFFWAYAYVAENGFSFSPKKICDHVRRGAGYVAVAAVFLLFVWINGGVAIGDQESHRFGFYMGNLYFFLAVVGVLFLPLSLASFRTMERARLKKRVLLGVMVGMVAAGLFLLVPPEVHEYNLKLKFLRNIVLSFAYHEYAWAYALAILFGSMTLSLMRFGKESLSLFPFVVVSLLPSLLVEQRYLIIPLVFILLFRKGAHPMGEYATVAYFLLLSSGLTYLLLEGGIFF